MVAELRDIEVGRLEGLVLKLATNQAEAAANVLRMTKAIQEMLELVEKTNTALGRLKQRVEAIELLGARQTWTEGTAKRFGQKERV